MMFDFPNHLYSKLLKVSQRRSLPQGYIIGGDFYSNDYLGLARSKVISEKVKQIFQENFSSVQGGTGSRLISGNHPLYPVLEKLLCDFYSVEAALVFNSGYQANLGLLSAVLQRQDVVIYDSLSHASIKDGIRLGFAKGFSFAHNDLDDLTKKILYAKKLILATQGVIYVVVESLYSMDGDTSSLQAISKLCKKNACYLIIDEAHATGVFEQGRGLAYPYRKQVFAQVHTFGKAIGSHGAVVLGSQQLKDFLINFSRPFIYTTALPPHTLAQLCAVYHTLNSSFFYPVFEKLWKNIDYFNLQVVEMDLTDWVSCNRSPIQTILMGSADFCLRLEKHIKRLHFHIKAIFPPTVPKGGERLRVCLHSFNSFQEIKGLLSEIKKQKDLS